MRSGSLCEVVERAKTPLMWASCNGHMECVKILLDRGAQVNMQDEVSAVKD